MRYAHIISAVYGQPWLITPAGHSAIQSLVESHILTSSLERIDRQGADVCGNQVDLPGMEIKDGIAHIPIKGVIGSGLSMMEKGSGAVDTGDIANEIAQAEADPAVKSILFHIDSPGGMVSGTPELAHRIESSTKPTFAFAYTAASAAYWIASSTNGIFATQTSDIGSIGVYMPWIDSSRALENRGIKVELIKAGKYKGAGFPGTVLSDAQRSQLQDRVNKIHKMFKTHVQSNRGTIADEVMQGQTFLAGEALSNGLIDEIVPNVQAAIGMIS